jgi:uncharacterized membrane protein
MRRLTAVLGDVDWPDRARQLAGWLNPVVASAAAPLETVAALDAVGPSLMPRTSRLAGVSMGLSVLAARSTTSVAERLTKTARRSPARPDPAAIWPRPAQGCLGTMIHMAT